MRTYVLRRLALIPVFMFCAATLVFFVMRVLPGDPALAMLGEDATSANAAELFRQRAGLDVPIWEQYLHFLGRLVTFDLGESMQNGLPISERIGAAFPYTAQLVVAASVIGLVLGTVIGLGAAFRPKGVVDVASSLWVGIIGGIPSYVIGIGFMLIFAIGLGWTPVLSAQENLFSRESMLGLVVPALALGLGESASIARITRTAASDLLSNALFVGALRGRGVSERRIKYVHVLRNSLVPVTAVASAQITSAIAGTVLIEMIFSRPGIGSLLVFGLEVRDFPVVESTLLIFSGLVILIGMLSDLLQGLIDPRVSYK